MDIQYKGMTVNERLYVSGLMEEFDKAVKEEDVEKVMEILKEVEITDESSIKLIFKELGIIEKSQE
jgi:hypothetical protein